ncbi:hypothetical protein GCM10010447_35100 [Streptomyces fulvorobeus]
MSRARKLITGVIRTGPESAHARAAGPTPGAIGGGSGAGRGARLGNLSSLTTLGAASQRSPRASAESEYASAVRSFKE